MASLIPGSITPVQASAPIIFVESIPSTHNSSPSKLLLVPCGIANLYREIGNAKEAIKYYNHAIKLEPLNIAFHWLNMTLFLKYIKIQMN